MRELAGIQASAIYQRTAICKIQQLALHAFSVKYTKKKEIYYFKKHLSELNFFRLNLLVIHAS